MASNTISYGPEEFRCIDASNQWNASTTTAGKGYFYARTLERFGVRRAIDVGSDRREEFLQELTKFIESEPASPRSNPIAERGARLEALGKAMQDGKTTVADLLELAHAAGLELRFRIDDDGG